jgi:hypothetical protein
LVGTRIVKVITFDAETFFDTASGYSLKSISTEHYVRDSRFKCHGAAIKWTENTAPQWYDEPRLRYVLSLEDWSDTAILAHHAQFDLLILSHHYGIQPKFIFDSLSCARLLLGNHLSVGLESLAKHFNLAAKNVPYKLFDGKQWSELTPEVRQQVADGCCHDVALTWQIFKILAKEMPMEEWEVIDHTIRMFTQPVLGADVDLLAKIWEKEDREKRTRLAYLRVSDSDLQSSDKFAALLRAEGVEPETKDGKKGQIYCFAKTDRFMEELLEDEDDRIRALAEARIGAKSTLLQTRAETLGWMASRGPLCVYLRVYGAHTTRWSGGDGCLTADTQVLVFDPQRGLTEKRIVDILLDDLIWDGEEFVAHGGVAFRGYKEVIEHDGVEGTYDHVVFADSGDEVSLAQAALRRTSIMDCRPPTDSEVDAVARGRYQLRSVPLSVWHRKNRAVQRTKIRKV